MLSSECAKHMQLKFTLSSSGALLSPLALFNDKYVIRSASRKQIPPPERFGPGSFLCRASLGTARCAPPPRAGLRARVAHGGGFCARPPGSSSGGFGTTAQPTNKTNELAMCIVRCEIRLCARLVSLCQSRRCCPAAARGSCRCARAKHTTSKKMSPTHDLGDLQCVSCGVRYSVPD